MADLRKPLMYFFYVLRPLLFLIVRTPSTKPNYVSTSLGQSYCQGNASCFFFFFFLVMYMFLLIFFFYSFLFFTHNDQTTFCQLTIPGHRRMNREFMKLIRRQTPTLHPETLKGTGSEVALTLKIKFISVWDKMDPTVTAHFIGNAGTPACSATQPIVWRQEKDSL